MNKKKLRYAMLKEIDKGNDVLTEKDFNVEEEVFSEAAWFLEREGYLIGVDSADDRAFIEGEVKLTEKGENYLEENSMLAKGYKGLKEIREWIK